MKKSKLYKFISVILGLLIISTAVCSYVEPCVGEECHIVSENFNSAQHDNDMVGGCAHAHHVHSNHNFLPASFFIAFFENQDKDAPSFYKDLVFSSIPSKIYRPPIA
ncbi:MAG: hypothetical protein ACK5N8_00310 [Alphaproteobacteria bacterium]